MNKPRFLVLGVPGQEKALYKLAQELLEAGHEYSIDCQDPKKEYPFYKQDDCNFHYCVILSNDPWPLVKEAQSKGMKTIESASARDSKSLSCTVDDISTTLKVLEIPNVRRN